MTHRNRARLSKLSLALIAALAAAPVFAQSTSAGVGGTVVGADGQPVAGAEVTITHVASGTTSRTTTDAAGNYAARGLRVGGPYTITITKAGAGSSSRDNVYLALDQVADVDATLNASVTTLGSVQVFGTADNVFLSDNKGLGQNLDREALDNTPAADRSIQDIARLDPRIVITDRDRGAISANGQNFRYNSITVDSINAGDPFGLNDNGLPTLGTPISQDAIAEYNLSTAKYDVANRRGVGANINAVTKSGTNEFHGSAYYAFRNAGTMIGGGKTNTDWTGFTREWTGGLTLGGPIIKDKLFFFASYEQSTRSGGSGNSWGPEGSGAGNIVDGLTPADVQTIIDIAKGKNPAMNPGDYGGDTAADRDDKRLLVKLDWNINDYHRASLTYTDTKEYQPVFARNFDDKLVLSSGNYFNDTRNTSYALHFYDDWSENFSTEFSFSDRDFHKDRGPLVGGYQPDVTVATVFRGPEVQFGTEYSSQANVLDVQSQNAAFSGIWYVGDHVFKAGVDYQRDQYYNLFLQNSVGSYIFDSPTDFINGDYYRFRLQVPAAGYTMDDVAARFELKQYGFFVQDDWQVNDKLSLQYGLRYDVAKMPKDPVTNPCIAAPVGPAGVGDFGVCVNEASSVPGQASGGFGISNTTTIDNSGVLQPRVSFNYRFNSERDMQLRGGLGLFISNTPAVWVGNPYSGNGVSVASYDLFFGNGFSSDPNNQIPAGSSPVPGSGDSAMRVDTVDPDFSLPTVWKASLAFDRELPWWGMVFSAEYQLLKTKDAIFYQSIDLTPNPNGVLPDGRLTYFKDLYASPFDRSNQQAKYYGNPSYDTVTRLTNSPKGWSDSLTLQVKKPFANHWSASIGLTKSRAKDVNSGTSSVAYSNFKYRAWVNPNEAVLATSDYSIPYRAIASLTWKYDFFGDNTTRISAFFDGHSGSPYSWVYGNDINGDTRSTDLFYIPSSVDDVEWSSGVTDDMKQQFMDYINSDSYLSSHKGQIASRNSGRAPWVSQLDLSISQEIPSFFKGHKAEVRLDIYNFTNLLNNDWGVEYRAGFPLARSLAEGDGVNPLTGKYIYDITDRDYMTDGRYHPSDLRINERADTNPSQRWSVLMTLRYEF